MATVAPAAQEPIRSTVPARLDRLGWSPFHTRMVAGLGAAWILDGLQITIASSVTGVLSSPQTLGMTPTEIGLIASVYLVGEMVGALFFGRLSDQLGRRRLLIVTLLLYLLGTGLAAFTTGNHTGWLLFFYATRLIAGTGIGGAVCGDQLGHRRDDAVEVPGSGRHLDQRHLLGRRDPRLVRVADLPQRLRDQRRLAAGLPDGAGARVVVIVVARTLPESPRWLITHGRNEEAEAELPRSRTPRASPGRRSTRWTTSQAIELVPEKRYGYLHVPRAWCSASTRSGRSSAPR